VADFQYVSGNPIMDQGVGNAAIISLFTREGWPGNIFLPGGQRIGSGFEKTCKGTLTLSKLADVERAAETALAPPLFPEARATARNPHGDRLEVTVTIGSGGALSLTREGPLWKAQAELGGRG
jgi:hypothetical protein